MSKRTALLIAALSLTAASIALPNSAQAGTGINSFTMTPSTTQAGGHPDVTAHIEVDGRSEINGIPGVPPPGTCNCGDAKQVSFHFPTGLIGDPHSMPACSLAEFSQSNCSSDTQVGILTISHFGYTPIFNMETHPDEAGVVGFVLPLLNAPSFVVLSARTGGDYGLDATSSGIFHLLPTNELNIHLWGVPADPSHDYIRFPTAQTDCFQSFPAVCFPPVSSNVHEQPYLENPTSCSVSLESSADVSFYNLAEAHADAPWPGTTGCDQLSFNPSLTAKTTTTEADTASGLDIDIKDPQTQSPNVPSASEIRSTVITLPGGLSLTPNGSDGKVACTDSQAAFGTDGPAKCPEFSKVGTDSLDSSALPGPIDGAIYIGQPLPNQTFRLFLTADGFATHVKLKGEVHLDPQTGQIVTSFTDLPQSPFQEFSLHFFGSERGIYATPTQCGTYAVHTDFVPWDSVLPDQHSLGSMSIDSGPNGSPCPDASRPFTPQLQAGATNHTAGIHAPFALNLTRPDGNQNLTGLSIVTPPGFTATLKGIPYCPESAIAHFADPTYTGLAEQASPACSAASQIGTATTGAGAGTHPIYNSGKVYLAGPYKGAPLSLMVVVPALGGPYDLGNVAVRTALRVDSENAQITAVSDPLPQILEGIPLRTRSILINLDRPGFTLNPTNCDPFAITAIVSGDQGANANLSSPFQVANCADLGFSPKLALKLSGGTKRNGHPALHATLSANPGDANISTTQVTLPSSMQTDTSHLGSSCTRSQYAASACPASSAVGTATATSPLLDHPLTGTVYLESNGNPLPDIAVALRGQISIDLHGKVDTAKNGALRTTFETIPDVPISSFSLDLQGGGKGLIVNNTNICAAPSKALVKIGGQNGKINNRNVALNLACGNKARHKRHLGRHRG